MKNSKKYNKLGVKFLASVLSVITFSLVTTPYAKAKEVGSGNSVVRKIKDVGSRANESAKRVWTKIWTWMKNNPETTIAIGVVVALSVSGAVGFACYKSHKGKADEEPADKKPADKKPADKEAAKAAKGSKRQQKAAKDSKRQLKTAEEQAAEEQAAEAAVVIYKAVQEQGADEVAKVVVSVLKNEEDKTQQGRMVGQNRDKAINAMGHERK